MSDAGPPPPPPPTWPAEPPESRAWIASDAQSTARERLAVPPDSTWGLGDAVGGVAVALVGSVLVGAAILVALGYTDADAVDELSIAVIALLQIPLWFGYLGAPLWAAIRKGSGLAADLGWRFERRDIPYGLALGVAAQLVAVPLLYVPIFLVFGEQDVSEAARELTDRATGWGVLVLALVVVVGAPVVEELFFRGLLLRGLTKRGLPAAAAVAVSSLVFGAIHFQLLQLPALVMFGVLAGWLTVRSGRLGPAVWAHVGFNGVTVAVLLLVR